MVRTASATRRPSRSSSATWWVMPVRHPPLKKILIVAGSRDRRDPPPLRADDPAQQGAGVGAVALGHEAVDAQEEARLVGGGDARLEDRADGAQAGHVRRLADGAQAAVAHDGVDLVRGVVVARGDHRLQQAGLVGAERAVRRAAQDRDQQHRLDHAGRAVLGAEVEAAEATVLGGDREGDRPGAGPREALGRADPGGRRQRRRRGAMGGLLVAVAGREREARGGEGEEATRRGRCGSGGAGRPARSRPAPRRARRPSARRRACRRARRTRTSRSRCRSRRPARP